VYWVVPGRFAAGPYPVEPLEFDTFVDLTEEGELPTYEAADHRRFPVRDFGVATVEQMDEILAAVDEALDAGRTVYLHCRGGVGRTGTAVGCWLIRHGRSADEAVGPETEEQRAFVRTYA
jgi:protein-tyrosine phosphatase